MYKAGDDGWDPSRERAWDEPEAVRLLQRVGARVARFEATGARMQHPERYHARLIAAHDARDMAAYQIALNGYVEAAREACRQARRGG
jgi:plasmid replication initiation protein